MTHRKQNSNQTFLEVVVLVIIGLITGLFKLIFKGIRGKRGLSVENRNHITRKRIEIEQMLRSENIHELRQAVFEADKLVGYILENSGYAGETFAERLKSARVDIEPGLYENIWQGHKVRNQLAHEHEPVIRNSPSRLGSRSEADELRLAVKKLLKYTWR
jgi:hypothetical protein